MKQLISGNQAIIEGALKAGATYFAGYPITPASEIMQEFFQKCTKNKELIFLQTEDELAAIHSIIGASLAGRKSFTATSGPGFSLMQEGLGLAFAYEAPIVIVDAQRQGPSTGMPTMPSQGDILQTQYGSHGDTKTVVFYPNSVQECYRYTIEAFNTAQQLQTPVIVLTDGLLSHLIENVELEYTGEIIDQQNTPLTKSDTPRYYTGLITGKDGMPATKDANAYKEWIKQRLKKFEDFEKKQNFYEFYGDEKAENLIISFGFPSRVIYDLVDKFPKKYAMFRPITLFPILSNTLERYIKNFKSIYCLEMNEGQYVKALRDELLIDIKSIPVGRGGEITLQNLVTIFNL